MANYMKDVAKMLGVELNEEFKIKSSHGSTVAKLTSDGLDVNLHKINYYTTPNNILRWLLTGYATIERLPWKPAYNEHYFSIGPGGVIEPGVWMNDFVDRALYKLGNCYQYGSDAELNKDKWIAFYASDAMLEV